MAHRLLITIITLAISVPSALIGYHPAKAARTTLNVVWTTPTDNSVVALLNQDVADFEAENPDIDVSLTIKKTPEVRDILEKSVGTSDTPDISVMPARWVPEFVSLGMIEPIDRYITPEFRNRFIPEIIDQGAMYQQRTFGLPVGTSTRAMYYNKALLKAAGINEPPKTWDELLTAGKAVNALGTGVYGFGLQGGGGPETNSYFYYFVWGNGGVLYDENGTTSALNKPEAVEALSFLQTMILENATQPSPTSKAYETRLNMEDLFQAGKIAMVISGPWLANRLHDQAPSIDFGIAPIPYKKTPATYGVMDALVILSASHNKSEAWKFMQFMYDDKRRLDYTAKNGVLPELVSVAKAPEFTENKDFSVFISMLPTARFEPLHVQSEQIARRVIAALQAVYRGDAEPQDALSQAAIDIDSLLATTASGW